MYRLFDRGMFSSPACAIGPAASGAVCHWTVQAISLQGATTTVAAHYGAP